MKQPALRLIAGITLSGVLLASAVSGAWLVFQPTLAGAKTFLRIQRVSSSEFTGAPDKPFFFLALGNDSREAGLPGLGDSIHVIGIDPATRQGTMLNVPRDTEAPDGGKINSYHSSGGLPSIVAQLDKMMGITIDYAITTDFPRFIDMVNAIGGIAVDLPYDLSDGAYSGADFRPGLQGVDGDQALSIARDRHDFDRQGDRQRTWDAGLVILSALSTVQSHHPSAADTIKLLTTASPSRSIRRRSPTAPSRPAVGPARTSAWRPRPPACSPTSPTTASPRTAIRCQAASTPPAEGERGLTSCSP
jgi:LCP family protein required for cell wall assembly